MEGDGQTFHRMAPSALSFRSTAPLDEFQEVKVNGQTVDPSNYTLTEGSTIVTFNIDYLKSLGTEKHEVTVVSDSVSANADFEVIEPEINEHGFYYNQPYTAYVSPYGREFAFVIHENNTLDLIGISPNTITTADHTETCAYTLDDNTISINTSMGNFTGTITSNGDLYINELALNFVLANETIAADNDYLYVYDNSLHGYRVITIDNTKSSYDMILSNINNIPVVSIKDTFSYNENLITMPKLPNTITSIGDWAFNGCKNLVNVSIPNNITSIGTHAFDGCESLKSIEIPTSITSIGATAFTDLNSIIFKGTMNQWNNQVYKEDAFSQYIPATEVVCSDGTVSLS